jgi:hypothetical protein
MQIIEDRKRFPDIAAVEIKRPVFIIGMGRTGSTLLQSLLAQDPGFVAPRLWETMLPSPPPRFGMGEARQARVSQIMSWYLTRMPGILISHPYFVEESYNGLAECGSIGEMSFVSYLPFGYMGTVSHFEWFANADNSSAISFHKMVLQHLQWSRENRTWACKAVENRKFLSVVLNEYPAATFIWTHRDPLTQAASLASGTRFVGDALCFPREASDYGRFAVLAMKLAAERGMEARRKATNCQFIDVYYPDLVADPIGTVRSLYQEMGRPHNAEAELNMSGWLNANSAEKGGKHKYSHEKCGIHQ